MRNSYVCNVRRMYVARWICLLQIFAVVRVLASDCLVNMLGHVARTYRSLHVSICLNKFRMARRFTGIWR